MSVHGVPTRELSRGLNGGGRLDEPRDPAELLKAAADGDHMAWTCLVDMFGPRMWSVARACGLGEADTADAVQGAWLRLLEHLYTIRDPSRLGAWLATTARHEALLIGKHGPVAVIEDMTVGEPDPASALLEADSAHRLWLAVSTLHEPCRTLLGLYATDVGPQQIAVRMGVPVGSVGPTRARCLNKLRTLISLEETVQ